MCTLHIYVEIIRVHGTDLWRLYVYTAHICRDYTCTLHRYVEIIRVDCADL